LREWELANFTLKLGKIVALNDPFDFLLDLRVDPGLEAADMNESATAFAIAGRDQGVRFSFLAAEADFAASFSFLESLIVFL
jgi:hypothetical protein